MEFTCYSTCINYTTTTRIYQSMQQRLSKEPIAEVDEDPKIIYNLWVSFAEIYNDQIFDLLQKNKLRPSLKLGQRENGTTYIKNLSCVHVSSGLEAYQILHYGMNNLKYAATNLNPHSSRSHCIFTIKLVQISHSQAQISHVNFCDLAGSENIKKTGNTMKLKAETGKINASLHVLGRCIKTLRDKQKKKHNTSFVPRIPYRESKLTMLFQSALSGQESVKMIFNLNGDKETFNGSQHVLSFSAIVSDIVLETETTTCEIGKRFSSYVQSEIPSISDMASNDETWASTDDKLRMLAEKLIEHEHRYWQIQEEHEKERARFVAEFKTAHEEKESNWQKVFDTNEEYWKQRLAEQKREYEAKIDEIRAEQHQVKRIRLSSVVDLTEDDDVDIEELQEELAQKSETCEFYREELERCEAQLKMEIAEKSRIARERDEKKEMLKQGAVGYHMLLLKYKTLQKELVMRNRCSL